MPAAAHPRILTATNHDFLPVANLVGGSIVFEPGALTSGTKGGDGRWGGRGNDYEVLVASRAVAGAEGA